MKSRAEELHLSDVHLRAKEDADAMKAGSMVPCDTTFTCSIASAGTGTVDSCDQVTFDSDGDVCVKRRRKQRMNSLGKVVIRHAASTKLDDVGLQVWRGALLLADHILTPSLACRLDKSVVMELGAGCGFTSIVAALCGARTVFCTDSHRPSLRNAVHNALINGVDQQGTLEHPYLSSYQPSCTYSRF